MSRLRNWCFTDNVENENDEGGLRFEDDLMAYLVQQKEKVTRVHWQGYVEFKKAISLKQLKEWYGNTIHWEGRKGSRDDARKYCMKEESRVEGPFEFGEWGRQGKRSDLLDFAEDAKAGRSKFELMELHPQVFIKFNRGMNEMIQMYESKVKRDFRQMTVMILKGQAGCGKTQACYRDDPELYAVPYENGKQVWWNGYIGQEAILLDDYTAWFNRNTILRILDGYPLQLQTKGGFAWAKFTRVYITTNLDMEETFGFWDDAIRRRVYDIFDFDKIDENS
jgi:hypothetical protein